MTWAMRSQPPCCGPSRTARGRRVSRSSRPAWTMTPSASRWWSRTWSRAGSTASSSCRPARTRATSPPTSGPAWRSSWSTGRLSAPTSTRWWSTTPAGARAATAHLLAHGHRRIACLADRQTIWTSGERQAGYAAALAEAGSSTTTRWSGRPPDHRELRPRPCSNCCAVGTAPTAIFAARNNLAIGTVRALRELGRQHDVALVGFDDFPMADLVDPATTVVAQDVTAVGARAAELLFARLGGTSGEPQRIVLPTTLIPRGSGRDQPSSSPRLRPGPYNASDPDGRVDPLHVLGASTRRPG